MAELSVSKLDDSNDSIKLNGVPSDANLDCENEEDSRMDDEQDSCAVGRKRATPTNEMNNVDKLHDSSTSCSITDKSSNALANGHLRLDKVPGECSSAADEREAVEPTDGVSPAQASRLVADDRETHPADEDANVISNGEDSNPSSPPADDSRSDEGSSLDQTRIVSNIGSATMPLDLGPNEIARTNSGLSITMVPTPRSSDEQNSRWDRTNDERKTDGSASDRLSEVNTKDVDTISLCSPSDKQGKKYQKKSLPSVNITPRRSSRNINKQRSYNDKDGDIYEDGSPDGIQMRKLDDDDIEEITPTDPLADDSRSRQRSKAIVVSDTKGLVEFATNARISKSNKKEPTLVIIDTKSILSGRGPVPVSQSSGGTSFSHSSGNTSTPIPVSLPLSMSNSRSLSVTSSAFSVIPIGLPTTGLYPQFRNPPPQMKPIVVGPASTTVTPISIQAASTPATSSVGSSPASVTAVSVQAPTKQPPAVLPSLTDDMFVVEAPSFIVPYVYEKPPMKALKEYIEKIETEIKEAEEKKAEEKRKSDVEEKSRLEALEKEKSEAKESELKEAQKKTSDAEESEKEKEDGLVEEGSESAAVTDEADDEEPKAKPEDEGEASKPASEKPEAMEVDAEESERTASNEVVTADKSKVNDSGVADAEKKDEPETSAATAAKDDSKKSTNAVDDSKKPQSFFDNPLGKFFIQIGLNLVQEHVQTDLLRSQKRKRDKEGENCSPEVHATISELTRTLESSKENNDPFKLETKKCELCSFRTESILVMAHHLETPHMKNYTYRCNFCPHEVRSPHDILYHMEAEHNVRGRLERAPAFHQCANCPFEDNQKGKLTRHMVSCAKKYRPERNQEPPLDWEPPAKIPRVTRNRPPSMSPGNAVYQAAMSGLKQVPQNSLLPKLMPNASNAKQNMMNSNKRPSAVNTNFVGRFPNANAQPNFQQRPISLQNSNQGLMYRTPLANSQTQVLLPQNFQFTTSPTSLYQATNVKQPQQGLAAAKLMNQPSISITPLPRQSSASQSSSSGNAVMNSAGQVGKGGKSGAPASAAAGGSNNKNSFVVCEICDGYIKDLEQLRNHMQWIHKVKIHPKMIYNRPPLNCQKCQFRFFTDQGLERHLLGSHGLVTSSMQEAANKGKDGGRCPICGRVYQWKLLNHVARDHQMALKPAHLSYKCTVCTATFGMYKQFETHVYSAHSVVAKRAMDPKKPTSISSSSQNDALLKPLKINDEITIIPQPVRSTKPMNKMIGSGSSIVNARSKDASEEKFCPRKCTRRDFSTYDEFKRHLLTQHVRKFNVKLTRVDDGAAGESQGTTPTTGQQSTSSAPESREEEALLRKHHVRSFHIRLPNLGVLREDLVYRVQPTPSDEDEEEAAHRRALSFLRFSMTVDESRLIEISSVPYRVRSAPTKRRLPAPKPRATTAVTTTLHSASENTIAECGTFGNHFLTDGRAPPSNAAEDKSCSLSRAISFSTAYATDATKAHPVLAPSLGRDVGAGTIGVPIASRTSSAPANVVVVRNKIFAKTTFISKPQLPLRPGLPAGAFVPVSIAANGGGGGGGGKMRVVRGRLPSHVSSANRPIFVAIQPAKATTPISAATATTATTPENDVIILSSSDSEGVDDDNSASDKKEDEIVVVQPRKADSATVQEYILPM